MQRLNRMFSSSSRKESEAVDFDRHSIADSYTGRYSDVGGAETPFRMPPPSSSNGLKNLAGSIAESEATPSPYGKEVDVDDRDGRDGAAADKGCCGGRWPTIKKTMIKLYLPIGMLFMVFFGAVVPQPGEAFDSIPHASDICVGIIFFVSGMKLSNSEFKSSFTNWHALLYGFICTLFVTPWFASIVVAFGFSEETLPKEYVLALAVFLNTPTTVTSCVVLTAEARGNRTMSIMLAATCNLVGVFTLPFLLPITLIPAPYPGVDSKTGLNQTELVVRLVETLLIPLVCGKLLLEFWHPVRGFVQRNNKRLKIVNNTALICIIWMNASRHHEELRTPHVDAAFLIMTLSMVIHFVLLGVNYCNAKFLMKLDAPEVKSLVFVCSQKSEVIALAVLPRLHEDVYGGHGLLTVGFLVVYLPMLVFDGFVAYFWAKGMPDEGENGTTEKTKLVPGGGFHSSSSSSEDVTDSFDSDQFEKPSRRVTAPKDVGVSESDYQTGGGGGNGAHRRGGYGAVSGDLAPHYEDPVKESHAV